jgi:hypothetical protein
LSRPGQHRSAPAKGEQGNKEMKSKKYVHKYPISSEEISSQDADKMIESVGSYIENRTFLVQAAIALPLAVAIVSFFLFR